VSKIFKTTTIENGLRHALATGNWGIKTGATQGVSQVLSRYSLPRDSVAPAPRVHQHRQEQQARTAAQAERHAIRRVFALQRRPKAALV
jgi:DNA-directed RNA polymerase beta subunit